MPNETHLHDESSHEQSSHEQSPPRAALIPPPLQAGLILLLLALGGITAIRPVISNLAARLPEPLHVRIDPNTAAWWELAILPGLGENGAKAVIEAREQGVIYSQPGDLEAVAGTRLQPDVAAKYLRFPW